MTKIYSSELSIDAKMSLQRFLDVHHLAGKTRILRETTPILFFDNHVGVKRRGVEIVSQYHPVIRFVSEELRAKEKAGGYFPVSAVEVSRLNTNALEEGIYVYAVARWSISGARDIERLEYSVFSHAQGQWLDSESAERLVNVSAMHGRDWYGAQSNLVHRDIAGSYDSCLKKLEENFVIFEGDIQRENNDRINLMINTLERHRKSQEKKTYDRIIQYEVSGDQRKTRLIPAEMGKLQKINRKISERIAMLKSKQVIQSSEGMVSGGVIRVY